MKEKLRYGAYFFQEGVYHVFKIKRKPVYDNLKYLDDLHANQMIAEKIYSGNPFMAGRFGSGEMRAFRRTLEVRWGIKKEIPEETLDSLCINAGFFPRDPQKVMKFGEEMEKASRQVDLIAVWEGLLMENYVYDTFLPQAKRCFLSGLEPFFCGEPWTQALEGKNVLVIHPFEETIQRQFVQRKYLFEDPRILPDFHLETLKAVQSIGGVGDSLFTYWCAALDYITEDA